MKACSKCNTLNNDDVAFCSNCGAPYEANQNAQQSTGGANVPPGYVPYYNPYDHTGEFEPKDISDNKVIAMLIYLMGAIGIVIGLLAGNSSKYVAFHIRQALKITVVELLGGVVAVLLCWTVVAPLAYAVLIAALFVVRIVAFFQICSGKAVEPAIIRGLAFLK